MPQANGDKTCPLTALDDNRYCSAAAAVRRGTAGSRSSFARLLAPASYRRASQGIAGRAQGTGAERRCIQQRCNSPVVVPCMGREHGRLVLAFRASRILWNARRNESRAQWRPMAPIPSLLNRASVGPQGPPLLGLSGSIFSLGEAELELGCRRRQQQMQCRERPGHGRAGQGSQAGSGQRWSGPQPFARVDTARRRLSSPGRCNLQQSATNLQVLALNRDGLASCRTRSEMRHRCMQGDATLR
jgi:hypothetical protein